MLDERILKILVCPKCKGSLEYKEKQNRLICHKCNLAYKIEDDIPIMLIDEAENLEEK